MITFKFVIKEEPVGTMKMGFGIDGVENATEAEQEVAHNVSRELEAVGYRIMPMTDGSQKTTWDLPLNRGGDIEGVL